jgi:acetyl-CoA C-acetyltransferase
VTAGNTCVAADGAAASVVMSAGRAAELQVQPLARIVASAVSGCEPELMGIGPVEASRRALEKAGVTATQLDIVECHESFAAQVLAVCDELGVDVEGQLNPFGGALALGHPPGATGARLVGTLVRGLAERDGTLGLATTCVAGGQGVAMVVERLA